MSKENETELSVSLPGEWALKKAFGPVLDELGEDMKRLYAVGRDKIFSAAYKKIKDPEDGKKANLRVTRDVLWNGAFTDNSICAEYFGGILASSRSSDGKDDGSVHYVDTVKSLSSAQLELHYQIYKALNGILIQENPTVNVAQATELKRIQIWFSQIELQNTLKLSIDTNLNVLYREGLINSYETSAREIGDKFLPFASVKPTIYGVLLYAAGHNLLGDWKSFPSKDFGTFDDITPAKFFASNFDSLARAIGFTVPNDPDDGA